MKIGLLSDTHGYLDEQIFVHFQICDELWHAGDIGSLDLLERLEAFKPTVSVWGNIDDHRLRAATREDQVFDREKLKVLMTHIGGKPPAYNSRVRQLIQAEQPDIFVCGHSHILRVMPDKRNSLLYLNPGAAGIHGFHKMKTLLRFDLEQGRILNMEVIELGLRGSIPASMESR